MRVDSAAAGRRLRRVKHPLPRSLSAVGVAAALALLTSCSQEESAMTPELSDAIEKQCAGRVAPDSLSLELPEGAEAYSVGRWFPEGTGHCRVSASGKGPGDKTEYWDPLTVQVTKAKSPAEAAEVRDRTCAELRTRKDRNVAYTDEEGFCYAFSVQPYDHRYRAYEAVGPYSVELTVDGPRPHKGEPPRWLPKRLTRVMEDLRDHYGR